MKDELWQPDDVVLTTVGVDIGSTTSHLMFSRLRLQRISSFSSRFIPVERTVLHRSRILLTPYRADGSVDSDALGAFIEDTYSEAGLSHHDIDTGAVILTGTALESHNAAEVGELFATQGGRFVRATAGHRLEAILAAHGSGAVARSRREGAVVLNVDIGGSTTKLALVDHGEIVSTSAIRAGARTVPTNGLDARARVAAATAIANDIISASRGDPVPDRQLLEPLAASPAPAVVTFSGGVAEFLYRHVDAEFGDLGADLAAALRKRASALPGQLAEPEEGIRATVIGASQFSVQLSGSTIFVSDERLLPLRNVPVVVARIDADRSVAGISRAVGEAVARSGHVVGPLAVALPFEIEPRYADIRALADGLQGALGSGRPLVAAVSSDIALSLGRVLAEELGVDGGILVLDDLKLQELDYIDVGCVLRPAGVVPVVVKTLILGAR